MINAVHQHIMALAAVIKAMIETGLSLMAWAVAVDPLRMRPGGLKACGGPATRKNIKQDDGD